VKALVLVRPKDGILDPQGQAVETSLHALGFPIAGVRVGRLVELKLDVSDADEAREQIDRMCRQLLSNPLIESYSIELTDEPGEQAVA
jgi:phosphoribosylformylglycinamidine synthase